MVRSAKWRARESFVRVSVFGVKGSECGLSVSIGLSWHVDSYEKYR